MRKLLVLIVCLPVAIWADDSASVPSRSAARLWHAPANIASEDLFYGAGGTSHVPAPPFTFIDEDLDGTQPKFNVRDSNGIKWKVKLGPEVKPETVATRFVWAVGYIADEDYFLPEIRIEKLPPRLKRGQKLRLPGDAFRDVRLKRNRPSEEKEGIWKWKRNPFSGTRELNGLLVTMALLNNWDLKDVNNAVYERKQGKTDGNGAPAYLVSDLGASFGSGGITLPYKRTKGNLDAYRTSKFITKKTPQYVDFYSPGRPTLFLIVNLPDFIMRTKLRSRTKHIPREDARWIGSLLGQLSDAQIRDAFRAGGYSQQEIDGFSASVEKRILELRGL